VAYSSQGYVGEFQWRIADGVNAQDRELLSRMLFCAPFAGVGDQTAVGMGEVVVSLSNTELADRDSRTRTGRGAWYDIRSCEAVPPAFGPDGQE